jgi:CheY-like chemotaxis protein
MRAPQKVEPVLRKNCSQRILLVEDESLIAMCAVEMLEDLGYSVLQAYSGTRALEILGSEEPIDLMITDYARNQR